ncbi:DUF4845 domain-containing protein [Thiohalorhabdus sp.]|uniref:DUF4845 domain-containing protein n=1 Tax=Thiohalorhabdus sp. TaxID=3094134 RepID=UPI002FC2F8DC
MGGGRTRNESGAGLLAILFWLALAALVIWLGARVLPVYMEYWSIDGVFQDEVEKSDLHDSPRGMKKAVLEELEFQDIDRLDAADIEVERLAGGGYRVSAEYEETVQLSERVSLVFHFQPEAQQGG